MRRINYIRLGVAIMIALTASFYYCSKTENNPIQKDIQQNTGVNFLYANKWQMTDYVVPGNYTLKTYDGFRFTFTSSAIIYATRDGNTFRGTWSMGKDEMERSKLYINFGDQMPLNGMNNNWFLDELTSNSLKLEFTTSVAGDNGTGAPSSERPLIQRISFISAGGVNNPTTDVPASNTK
ncbi:MAG: hypothetical protein ACXVPQ_11090 [Bacteroidia bacterium]